MWSCHLHQGFPKSFLSSLFSCLSSSLVLSFIFSCLSCCLLFSLVVSSRLVSSRLVSSRLVSSRLVSSRLVSSRLVSSRLVSSRLVSSLLFSSLLFSSLLSLSLFLCLSLSLSPCVGVNSKTTAFANVDERGAVTSSVFSPARNTISAKDTINIFLTQLTNINGATDDFQKLPVDVIDAKLDIQGPGDWQS